MNDPLLFGTVPILNFAGDVNILCGIHISDLDSMPQNVALEFCSQDSWSKPIGDVFSRKDLIFALLCTVSASRLSPLVLGCMNLGPHQSHIFIFSKHTGKQTAKSRKLVGKNQSIWFTREQAMYL